MTQDEDMSRHVSRHMQQDEPLVSLSWQFQRQVCKVHEHVKLVAFLPEGLHPAVCDPLIISIVSVRLLQWLSRDTQFGDEVLERDLQLQPIIARAAIVHQQFVDLGVEAFDSHVWTTCSIETTAHVTHLTRSCALCGSGLPWAIVCHHFLLRQPSSSFQGTERLHNPYPTFGQN